MALRGAPIAVSRVRYDVPHRDVRVGEDSRVESVGRNDPCPCGSGKKYKKCCLGQDDAERTSFDGRGGFTALLQDEGIAFFVSGDSRDEVLWRAGGVPFEVGGSTLLKPDATVEFKYRAAAASHLLGLLAPGEYHDPSVVSATLNAQAEHLCTLIDELLGEIGHVETIEYFVFAHDQWSKAYDWARDHASAQVPGTLESEKADWVLERAPLMRRALKELIERSVTLYDPAREYSGERDHWLRDVQRAALLAEELMSLIYFSDLSYRLFPESTVLDVHEPDDWGRCFEVHSDEAERLMGLFRERVGRFSRASTALIIETPSQRQVEEVNQRVMSELGFEMSHSAVVLDQLKLIRTERNSFLSVVPLAELSRRVAEVHNLKTDDVCRILKGWSVYRTGLSDRWESHRPKRSFRMLTRPLVLLENHPVEPQVIIPVATLEETFRMAFELWRRRRTFPSEWGAAEDGESVRALEELGQAFDTQLEDLAADVLNAAGMVGGRVEEDALTQFGLTIPPSVGEIDYLGVNTERRLLVVGECKNLWAGRDPRLFDAERKEFLGKDGHLEQLGRKFDWVVSNAGTVVAALAKKNGHDSPPGPWRVAPLLLTNEEHFVADLTRAVWIESVALLAEDLTAGGLDWLSQLPCAVDTTAV